MKKVLNYILRSVGSIGLSFMICFGLSQLATFVQYKVMTLIPTFLANMFNFTLADVMRDSSKDMLIPGWGFLSSIVNDPNFSTRISIIISTITVLVVLGILCFLYYLLIKIVKGDKIFTFIFAITAVILVLYTSMIMYGGDDFWGIERGLGFYLASIVILGLQIIIKMGIATSLWKGEEW